MIKIFDENDRDFSTAGNIIIEPIKCNEIKKKSLNGWYIDVEVPIKYKDYIKKDKLCVVKTKSKLNPQAFRIGTEINYTTRKIKFKAEHVMFDARDYLLLDVRPTNQNGLNVLNYINQRTDEESPFSFYSNVENIGTAYFVRKNLLEAWTVIEERWAGVFDADNWTISFLTSVGNDNGETIVYGKNMQGFDIYEDWSSVCTKLCAVGYDGLMLPEQFLKSDIQYQKPYTRVVEFQTELETEEQTEENLLAELREKAEAYLEENKVPKVSYTIISNINGDLEIGDTIKVLHPFVEIFTEVLEYEYNLISKKIISLTFGNYNRDVKTKFNNIKNTIEKVNQAISKQEVTIKSQTNLINSLNKNGYVYIDENEILLLDTIPKEEAKNVWRFGLAGIGFSSNGYEGPFEVAMTMDGKINANFITTGTLAVSRIEGLANFISDTEKRIAEIEIEQDSITTRVSTVETVANNAQSVADSANNNAQKAQETAENAVEGINNITNTQGEAEGKNIHIEDSSEEPFVEVKLYGETSQKTRSGKNLFNVTDVKAVTSGVTVDEEGWITATYDNSEGTADIYLNYYTNNLNLKTGTDYNIIAEIKNVSGTGRAFFVSLHSSSQQFQTNFNKSFSSLANNSIYNFINKTLDTFLGNNGLRTYIYFPVGATGSITFRLSVCEDTTITPETFEYEAFGVMPSPDYPSEIENIEGNVEFKVTNGLEETDENYQEQVAYFPLEEGEKLYQGSFLNDNGKNHKRKQFTVDVSTVSIANSYQNVAYAVIPKPTDFIGFGNYNYYKVYCTIAKSKVINKWDDSTNINYISSQEGNKPFYLGFPYGTTLEEMKTALKGTVIEYDLVEPETVPYTQEQQEAWNNIKELITYKNITNITSDAYAKVVYMRDNGLDVYETKQNASKKYTETSEKLAEQNITINGVITQVSETNTRLTNDYLTAEQVNAEMSSTKEDIEILSQKQAKTELTSEQFRIDIDKIINEGVSKVKTSMGYTFDDEGFKLNRSNAETGTIIDEAAVRVIDKTGASEQNLLYAGYVKEGDTNYSSYIGQTIVASSNMIVENYLVVPNSRFEEYTNPVLGGKGTGAFEV